MFTCAKCGKPVHEVWNSQTMRCEPISRYWKGHDMLEVYCCALCSLLKHEEEI